MNRHINFHGKVKRYNHNLSYHNFFSGEIGELRPVWLEDAVPGDTFQYKPEVRLYFAPLVYPVLSSMKARVDVFFVPNRLAWSEWENFITGGPEDNLSPSYPSLRNVHTAALGAGTDSAFESFMSSSIGLYKSSIMNSLGHPYMASLAGSDMAYDPFDLIPLWDYINIWDEYYRDEEKETAITSYGGVKRDVFDIFTNSSIISLVSGLFPSGYLPSIAWSKDYFTTVSLEQQRGGDIPLLSNPIFQFADKTKTLAAGNFPQLDTGDQTFDADLKGRASDTNYYDLESVLTINGIYFLKAAQKWLNNNVIGGTRYIEQLRYRYRVVSSDARLQRPEMIGSISIPVNIDVVTQTSSTTTNAGGDVFALGDRAGKASVIGSGKTLTYSAEEFGYFIAILHIAPKAAYFQGIRRNLQREDKFDFWTPEFEHTPQREVRNNEIFCNVTTLPPESGGVFGYIGQYDEYRFHNDEVHGDFQDTLLAWTTARKFSSLPSAASSSFLRVDHDAQGNNRIFAVPSSEYSHIFGVVNNIAVAKREISNREPRF